MGKEGFDEKGNKYISMGKLGHKTQSWKRKETFCPQRAALLKDWSDKGIPVESGSRPTGSVVGGSGLCFEAHTACLNLKPIIRLKSPEEALQSCE